MESLSTMSSEIGEQKKGWNISDFEILKPLGKGQFGEVRLAQEKESGTMVAIKKISKFYVIQQNLYIELKREIEIQSRLKHKHIVQFYGYFQDKDNLYMVLEYVEGGNLYKHLMDTENGLDEKQAAKFVLQIATGIEYLRRRNVIHRDLKLENILMTNDYQLKIADFGTAVHSLQTSRKTFCGTSEYISPEMLQKQGYDHRIDFWALGILFYEMLYKISPFKSDNQEQTFEKIKAGSLQFPEDQRIISQEAKLLIMDLLSIDPQSRMSYQYLVTNQFIVNSISNSQNRQKPLQNQDQNQKMDIQEDQVVKRQLNFNFQ